MDDTIKMCDMSLSELTELYTNKHIEGQNLTERINGLVQECSKIRNLMGEIQSAIYERMQMGIDNLYEQ